MSALRTEGRSDAAHSPEIRSTGERGFTLVETLVALAVFALAFAGLYRALDGGWQGLRRAQLEIEAIEVAKSRLAAAGIATPLIEGREAGETADGVRWQIEIRKRNDDRPLNEATSPRFAAYVVSVTADRALTAGDRGARVVLRTVKLGERTP